MRKLTEFVLEKRRNVIWKQLKRYTTKYMMPRKAENRRRDGYGECIRFAGRLRTRLQEEIGIVPTTFNGLPGVQLVLLEKRLA